MLMAIFGAGASHDSVSNRNRAWELDEEEFQPALAPQLFTRRGAFDRAVLRHPTMWPVIDRLRHIAPGQYIEDVLEEIKAEAEAFPNQLQLSRLIAVLTTCTSPCAPAGSDHRTSAANAAALTMSIALRILPHKCRRRNACRSLNNCPTPSHRPPCHPPPRWIVIDAQRSWRRIGRQLRSPSRQTRARQQALDF
jgi:hypothetical protein